MLTLGEVNIIIPFLSMACIDRWSKSFYTGHKWFKNSMVGK